MKGIIFDIQRFALHDGPGIRTVVFLKGCLFRCVWCCNPESQSRQPQLAFVEEDCVNCGECSKVCDRNVFTSFFGRLRVRHDRCDACGKCIDVCTRKALKIYGQEVTSDEIIAEVLKDRSYYEQSGGGVTFSGGDPLHQFGFLTELLEKSKAEGLDTCVESEGLGSVRQFEELLPLVDTFYYDYKMTDPAVHRKYTGHDNEGVIENLKYLCTHGADVVLRCIIVPGVNDNAAHFRAIAGLGNEFKAIRRIEVFGYHYFGAFKYRRLGMKYGMKGKRSVEPAQVDEWISEIRKYGCDKIIKG